MTRQTFNSIDFKDIIRKHLFSMSITNLLGIIWRNDDDDDDGAGPNSRVARYLIPKEVGTVPDQELLEDFTNSWVSRFSMTSWYNLHHPHHWQKNNVLTPIVSASVRWMYEQIQFLHGVFRPTSPAYTHKILKCTGNQNPL